jgi:hypothetical protein
LPVNAPNVGNTTIEVKGTVYGSYDNGYGGSGRHELMFWIDSVQSVHMANESVIQQAFINGLNIGIGLVGNVSQTIHEYLTDK